MGGPEQQKKISPPFPPSRDDGWAEPNFVHKYETAASQQTGWLAKFAPRTELHGHWQLAALFLRVLLTFVQKNVSSGLKVYIWSLWPGGRSI